MVKLLLIDKSYIFSRGEVENVLVKDNKFILLADFMVLDMEEQKDVPIIMGRLFLPSGSTINDVAVGELMMRVFNEFVVIKVFEPSEYLYDKMTRLEMVQCEDSKCGCYFSLIKEEKIEI